MTFVMHDIEKCFRSLVQFEGVANFNPYSKRAADVLNWYGFPHLPHSGHANTGVRLKASHGSSAIVINDKGEVRTVPDGA